MFCRLFSIRFQQTSARKPATINFMAKVLNVAEKNDAAKCISDVMSNGRYKKV